MLFVSLQYYFAKNGLGFASPLLFMGLRFLIAGSFLLIFSKKLILDSNVVAITLMIVASTILWIYGLTLVSPSESAVISYSMPLFSIPLATLIIHELPTRSEISGIFIGLAGVIVYSFPLLNGFTEIGVFITFSNALFWGAYSVMFRKMRNYNASSLVSSVFLLGAVIILSLSLIDFHLNPKPIFFFDLFWLAIPAGAVSTSLWNFMLMKSKVNRITVLCYSIPVLTMVYEIILSRKLPDILSVVGILIMFLGIFISRKGGNKTF